MRILFYSFLLLESGKWILVIDLMESFPRYEFKKFVDR